MLKDNKVESNSTLNKLTNTKKSMVSYVQKATTIQVTILSIHLKMIFLRTKNLWLVK